MKSHQFLDPKLCVFVTQTKFCYRKLLFASFISLVLIPSELPAQFYGEFYYVHPKNFVLSSAQRTVLDTGWVMGGFRRSIVAGEPHFVINKVDKNGQFSTTNDFSMEYEISDNDLASCTGVHSPITTQGITVIETANTISGNGYVAAGIFVSSATTATVRGVFFMSLDAQGNVLNQYRWNFPNGPHHSLIEEPVIIESKVSPGDYFICGHYDAMTYVFRITSNATVVWENWYSYGVEFVAFDLIESPYSAASSELVIVGRAQDNTGSVAQEAFIMELDGNLGSINSVQVYSDGSGGDDWFTAIEVADHAIAGNEGYVVGGFSHSSTLNNYTYTPWMAHLDATYNIVWSTHIAPTYGNNLSPVGRQCANEINDVFQRRNLSGAFEYYGIAGSAIDVDQVSLNGYEYNYLSVYRLDNSGSNSLSPDEFRYFAGGHIDWGYEPRLTHIAAVAGGGASEGFQAFCTSTLTSPTSFYMVKAYYNGYAGCQDSLTEVAVYDHPVNFSAIVVNQTPFGSSCPGFNINYAALSISPTTLCASSSVGAGNNARFTGFSDTEIGGIDIKVFPNPASNRVYLRQNTLSNLTLIADLYDCRGQRVERVTFDQEDAASRNEFTLNLGENHLTPGLYFLRLSQGNNTSIKRLVIE